MWALFLLIFNFNTMSWDYANIDGALIFSTQEECTMPMTKYNKIMEQEKYVFVCEPWVPKKVDEVPNLTPKNGEQKLEDLLEQYKDDTMNKPDTKGTGDFDIFKNLGLPEPRGTDV